MEKRAFESLIKNFDFKNLFVQLGWDYSKARQPIVVDDQTYTLVGAAEKRRFQIFECAIPEGQLFPDYPTRRKIDHKISKTFFEHLIIYTDAAKQRQIWQFILRRPGQPSRVAEVNYHTNQTPELLFQKASGLFFSIDEEEKITIVDVTHRVSAQFAANAEKVTKSFYERFRKEHIAFYEFVQGIDDFIDEDNRKKKKSDNKVDNRNKQWYVSLMLNRLMFCYFIQKKGFLNKDAKYLANKLKETQERRGKNKFYSFYRDFLLVLFHEGLNNPEHSEKLKKEVGEVPYLNGGLFDVHELEQNYKEIEVDDKAFERIFSFFDDFNWHLDTRETATGKDINPDVIGYIFEKYINDRAAMGAYYTKEDITDYISKNCILPFLFDETQRQNVKSFEPKGPLLGWLRESNDDYIYEAVKYGIPKSGDVFSDLPKEIAVGLDTEKPNLLERRKEWNKPAPSDVALPTEIWREVIERRKRYKEISGKIKSGEITHINDFITYNLNIRQFANDVIENTDDPEFLKAFYKSLKSITILDPTCGSGAFLFAALNILEPLYETCIERMRHFIEEEDTSNKTDKQVFRHQFKFFRDELKHIQSPEHPNLSYFIYKSIILNNLYGVDIMKEAVEIAKLRLFLKLVATVEPDYRKPNLGLEPLPDIDFNIRAGNTLVGFARLEDVEKAVSGFEKEFNKEFIEEIKEEAEYVKMAYDRFRDASEEGDTTVKDAKKELRKKLEKLNDKLDVYQAKLYGIEKRKREDFEDWKISHDPFHWFAEFYGIIQDRGGFNVIIGNPPYLAMKKVNYVILAGSFTCSDLYGYVVNRAIELLSKVGKHGFIVMHNLAFSGEFTSLRRKLIDNRFNLWFSFFARIPSGLFSGDVRVRNCIYIMHKLGEETQIGHLTTRIHRWFSDARADLFAKLTYSEFTTEDEIPMFNDRVEAGFFQGLSKKQIQSYVIKNSKHKLFFKQSAYNWIAVSLKPAPCINGNGTRVPQTQVGEINFVSDEIKRLLLLLLNGRLFFSYWLCNGDEFHLTKTNITNFSFSFERLSKSDIKRLLELSVEFSDNLDKTIQYKLNAGKKVGTYNTSKLWTITDESDQIFLKHLCDNPIEVLDSVHKHVASTVITVTDVEEE